MWDFSETCSVSELRQGLNRLRQGYLTVDWSAVTYSRLEALLTPSKQLRSLFDAFAFGLEEHARADFLDMAVAIALTCAGSFQDRLEFIFDAFCGEDARGLDRDGVRNMLACVARAATTIRLAPALDDYAIDDAVAASFRDGSEELTKTEFLSFVKNDEISLAYLETLGIVPTVQKILKQYKNREDMYQYLSLLRKARPVWTIGYQGLAGSKRARDAEVRAANVAKWLFLVDPFVTLLEGGYCLALEVRREVRLLFHVEQVVPDGGERHEGVSGTALQVLREGAPPSDPSFSDDPQMRKAKSAQVFSRMLQPGGLRTVSLLLAHGIRHTISIAIDPISYTNMEVSNTQSCPAKPVPVWSAEFAAPCIRPSRTPDSLGPQAERRNRGIVSVALMSPEMNSEFKQRRAALAVNNADVLLHLGTCLADYVPVLRLVGRALLRAENGDASSAEDTLDQATQMIHEIHRKRIADQTGHDVIPSASGDTHSGYDSRTLHVFSTDRYDASRLSIEFIGSPFLDQDAKSGPDEKTLAIPDEKTLRNWTDHVLTLLRCMEGRFEATTSASSKEYRPCVQHIGPTSVARLWEIWEDAKDWEQVEERLRRLLENVNEKGVTPGRLILILSSSLLGDDSRSSALTACQFCEKTQLRRYGTASDETYPAEALHIIQKLYKIFGVPKEDPREVRLSESEKHRIFIMLIEWCQSRSGRDVALVGVNKGRRIIVSEIGISASPENDLAIDMEHPVLRHVLAAGVDEEASEKTMWEGGRIDTLAWRNIYNEFAARGCAPPLVANGTGKESAVLEHFHHHSQMPSRGGFAILLAEDQTPGDPRVIIGPIVGTVSALTAVIMLELDSETPIRIDFTPLTSVVKKCDEIECSEGAIRSSFSSMQRTVRRTPTVAKVSVVTNANRPTTVRVNGLCPGTRYHYVIRGISNRDPAYGYFQTESLRIEARSILALQSARLGAGSEETEHAREVRDLLNWETRAVKDITVRIKALSQMKSALRPRNNENHRNRRTGVDYTEDVRDVDNELRDLREKLASAEMRICQFRGRLAKFEKKTTSSSSRAESVCEGQMKACRKVSWEYPCIYKESTPTAALGRMLHSCRPDFDVVLHLGPPFGHRIFSEMKRILADKENALDHERKVEIRLEAYKAVRNALREVWSRPTSRAALANGSHILLTMLDDIVIEDARSKNLKNLNLTYEAASICLDVINEYASALREASVKHVSWDSQPSALRSARKLCSIVEESGLDRYRKQDSNGSFFCSSGSIGIVFVRVATAAARTGTLARETHDWLSKTLLGSSAATFSGTTLVVVTDFLPREPNTSPLDKVYHSLLKREISARCELVKILENWRSKNKDMRDFHIISSGAREMTLEEIGSVVRHATAETVLSCSETSLCSQYAVVRCAAKTATIVSSHVCYDRAQTFARLSLGPIIGEVTCQAASLLVEVTATASIILQIRRIGFGSFDSQRSERWYVRNAPGNFPVTFSVYDLEPNSLYEYAITVEKPESFTIIEPTQQRSLEKSSKVWGALPEGRGHGTFRTLAQSPKLLRILAVRGPPLVPGFLQLATSSALKSSDAVKGGNPSSCTLAKDDSEPDLSAVCRRRKAVNEMNSPGSPVSIIVHFTGSSHHSGTPIVDILEEQAAPEGGDETIVRAIEEESIQRYCDEFRVSWGLPYTQDLMRCAPQLFAASPPLVGLAAAFGHSLLQRKMSAPDSKSSEDESPKDRGDVFAQVAAARYQDPLLISALSLTKDQLVQSAYADERSVSSMSRHRETRDTSETEFSSDEVESSARSMTSTFRRVGKIGILILETLPNNRLFAKDVDGQPLSNGSFPASGYPPFKSSQWELLQHARNTPDLAALIICSDRPILPEPPQWLPDGESEGGHTTIDKDADALQFIDSICEWLGYTPRDTQPKSAYILCGGCVSYGFKTVIYDRKHKCTFEQLCVGGLPKQGIFPRLRGSLAGRYDFEFSIPRLMKDVDTSVTDVATLGTYALSTIQVDAVGSRITAALKASDQGVSLVVGPVLGPFVMTQTNGESRAKASILLELDRVANVKCVCQDVLTGETLAGTLDFPAHRPRVVRVANLRLGRRYLVRVVVDGVDLISRRAFDTTMNGDDYEDFASEVEHHRECGVSFQTPGGLDSDFNVCILGDEPSESVARKLGPLWFGIDLTVHIGARGSFDSAIRDAALELLKEGDEERILERFRNEYRTAWSTPAMRGCLASLPNVMTGCARTLLAAVGAKPAIFGDDYEGRDREWERAVRHAIRLSQKVSFEYERQLWDHQGWSTRGIGHAPEGGLLTLHDGAVGIYFIDLGDGVDDEQAAIASDRQHCKIRVMSQAQREQLLAALGQHAIAMMIVVLECALFKPARNEEDEVAWEFRNEDLTWIAGQLSDWRDSRKGRDLQIVCGTGGGPLGWATGGLRSEISSQKRQPLQQLVTGNGDELSQSFDVVDVGNDVVVTHELFSKEAAVLKITSKRATEEPNNQLVYSCVVGSLADGTACLPVAWKNAVDVNNPALIDESAFYAIGKDTEVDAMREFVGGGGHGPGDPQFACLVKRTYKSSTMYEFFKAPELREHLRETSGPVFSRKLRIAIVELFRSLPIRHRAVLARLDDVSVGRMVIARACAEKEPPRNVEIWHSFISRCFGLAAALHASAHRVRRESLGRESPTNSARRASRDISEQDGSFHEEVHGLAELRNDHDESMIASVNVRPSGKGISSEVNEEPTSSRLYLPLEAEFADRPLSETEVANMKKHKAKHEKKQAVKKRMEKYQQRLRDASSSSDIS